MRWTISLPLQRVERKMQRGRHRKPVRRCRLRFRMSSVLEPVYLSAHLQAARPHTLPPSSLLVAHLSPCLHEQHTLLTTSLNVTQQRNEALASEIVEQKDEIEKLVSGLEEIVRDLERAAGMVQGDE